MNRTAARAFADGDDGDDSLILGQPSPDAETLPASHGECRTLTDDRTLDAHLSGASQAGGSRRGTFALGVKEQVGVDGAASRGLLPSPVPMTGQGRRGFGPDDWEALSVLKFHDLLRECLRAVRERGEHVGAEIGRHRIGPGSTHSLVPPVPGLCR